MKYSSYSLLRSTILPVSFTLYDGENSIFRAPHQALGRTLPFAILLYSHDSRCNLTVDSRTFQVEPGEGIVLPHNVRHDFCMPRAGHITWIHIFITAAGIPLMDLLKLRRCGKGQTQQGCCSALPASTSASRTRTTTSTMRSAIPYAPSRRLWRSATCCSAVANPLPIRFPSA